jgi:UDP-N-acetylglucosamine transferase subunit ALG13
MIFATVGTQLPFDRMLTSLDNWAAHNPNIPVFAQTGSSAGSFPHLETVSNLSLTEFQDYFDRARLVVAHAGMGTILSAAEVGKPLILMPRRLKFNEHRTDHQQDTANEMERLSNVTVVQDGVALRNELDRAVRCNFELGSSAAANDAPELEQLLGTIRDFVWDRPPLPASNKPADQSGAA